jgi:hypothetical protein
MKEADGIIPRLFFTGTFSIWFVVTKLKESIDNESSHDILYNLVDF